jgi:hypothetical protein
MAEARLPLRMPTWASRRRQAMEAYCGTVNRFDYAECAIHRTGRPTHSKIKELHRAWFDGGIPLAVELEE